MSWLSCRQLGNPDLGGMCAWTLSPQQNQSDNEEVPKWASILAAAAVIRVARRMDSTLCVPRARLRPRSLTRARAARAAAARAAAARRATRRAARKASPFSQEAPPTGGASFLPCQGEARRETGGGILNRPAGCAPRATATGCTGYCRPDNRPRTGCRGCHARARRLGRRLASGSACPSDR
jgi:hypothetical protein